MSTDTAAFVENPQREEATAYGLAVAGAAVFLVGAVRARDAFFVHDSLPIIASGGLIGLALGMLGASLLVSSALHDEWRSLDRLEQAFERSAIAPFRFPTTDRPEADPASSIPLRERLRIEPERTIGWVLVLVAGITLIIGARNVADGLYASTQVTYLIGRGVGGLFLLLLGIAGIFLADLRSLAFKLERIQEAHTGSPEPISSPARPILWFALFALAGLVMVAGWWRAADALRFDVAMDGLVIATAGLGLIAVLLTLQGLRLRSDLGARTKAVLEVANDRRGAPVAQHDDQGVQWWTAAGLTRFHRTACPALAGAGAERVPVAPAQAELEPCLLCEAGA